MLSTLAIDAVSGALTVTGSSPEVTANVAFNPSGNIAFGVYLDAITVYLNFAGVYGIGGLVVDPSGNFAYSPTGGAGGSILILKIDPSTGALTLLPGSPIAVPGAVLLAGFIDVP